jgi:hypothetical protein
MSSLFEYLGNHPYETFAGFMFVLLLAALAPEIHSAVIRWAHRRRWTL